MMMMGETDQWQTIHQNNTVAECSRTVAVHLLHELVALRAQIAATRRLLLYNRSVAGIAGQSGSADRLELMERLNAEVIAAMEDWLRTQIVALHDPVVTQDIVRATRDDPDERGT